MDQTLLVVNLSCAVPIWIDHMRAWPWADVAAKVRECSQIIAAKGDVLQFGGDGAAEAFNALAQGLAALSFAPGGVTAFGEHWEATHPDSHR